MRERVCTNCGRAYEAVREDDALCKLCLLKFKDRLYEDLMDCRKRIKDFSSEIFLKRV